MFLCISSFEFSCQDLLNLPWTIFLNVSSNLSSRSYIKLHAVEPYIKRDSTVKKFRFLSLSRVYLRIVRSLLSAHKALIILTLLWHSFQYNKCRCLDRVNAQLPLELFFSEFLFHCSDCRQITIASLHVWSSILASQIFSKNNTSLPA